MAAVPSIGRATRVERPTTPGAAAAGDLYERYSGQIFSYCLHQLGSREEAEDAVQTTFMNAFRGLSRGVVPELESAWLFKIAHNVCLSRRRSSWRRGKVEAPNNFEVLQEVVPGREQVADELIRLQDVLEDMPENQRRAILLREWQGLTYREISAELGLSQAAVETLIFRARRALAQGLEQDADTWKKRLRRGSDFGGIAGCLQALLSGGSAAAVKVAATAVAVATTAVAASPATPPRHADRVPSAPPKVGRHTTHRHAAQAAGSTLIVRATPKLSSPSRRASERRLPIAPARPATPTDAATDTPTTTSQATTDISAPTPTGASLAPPSDAPPPPADQGNTNADDTADRHSLSVEQPPPAETAEPPAPPADTHTPGPPAGPPGQTNRPDHPDHPDNGNGGHGNGNGNGNK